MKNRIGIGVIGTGFARKTQIPAFMELGDARVVSVSSGNPANAKAVASEFQIPHFSGNWQETVRHPDVDLVCVTTPPDRHLEMTAAALRGGKHVLCEKPMAMNSGQASEMSRLAADAGKLAIIDHELRFTNGRQEAFNLIRDGRIGKIRHVKYSFRAGMRGDPQLPWTWWSDVERGGGALGAIGSHSVDTIRWLTESDVTEVSCRLHTHIKQRMLNGELKEVSSDDEALMILKLAAGDYVEDATACVSNSVVEAGPPRNRIELFGETGALRIEDGGELFYTGIKESEWRPIEVELGEAPSGCAVGGWSRGFRALAGRIVETLLSGAIEIQHAATFDDGLAVQNVLDAARHSNELQKVVHL